MNAELGREASRIEELQVQPPLAIDYKPAGPGDIRIKPESVICGALNFEKPLRDRLGLRRDVSVRGSVNGAFQRTIKLSNLSSFKTSKGLRRFNGVFQASNSMQLEYYYDRCRWNNSNIYVDLVVGLNYEDCPYRIEVTIRQGNREWRRIVVRRDPSEYPRTRPLPVDRTRPAINEDMDTIGRDVFEYLNAN